MPKYDLAGNPLAEPAASTPPQAAPMGAGPAEVKYDLAGNPLPAASPPPAPAGAPFMPPSGAMYAPRPAGGPPSTARPMTVAAASNESGGKRALWMGLGLAIAAVIGIVSFLLMPKHGTTPTTWTTFTASDKSFSCAAPGGWETTTSDKAQQMVGKDQTTGGVQFRSGSASIEITTDTVATLMSYILVHGNGDTDALTGAKAGSLHKQWKIATSAIHKGYQETTVAPIDQNMGDARLSEWTANGNVFGLGGRVHGYRASLVGGNLTAVVVCQCLDSDWPALKPAFRHVIASVKPPAPAARRGRGRPDADADDGAGGAMKSGRRAGRFSPGVRPGSPSRQGHPLRCPIGTLEAHVKHYNGPSGRTSTSGRIPVTMLTETPPNTARPCKS